MIPTAAQAADSFRAARREPDSPFVYAAAIAEAF
jgi:hypothetical protein